MTAEQRTSLARGGGWWLAYLSLVAPIVAYEIVRFGALYPTDSLAAAPELSIQYKAFVQQSGVALAVVLGVAAAAYGTWRRSVLQGAIALALGVVSTVAALSVVPWVRFPEDQYPPAALFVIADGLPLLIAFGFATLAGLVILNAGSPDAR